MKSQETRAYVEQMTPLTEHILRLDLLPDEYIDYQAGQYLQIMLSGIPHCYSIANAPRMTPDYELHIRHCHDNPSDQSLLKAIKQHEKLTIRLPFGDCFLRNLDPKKPILFLASGTGFSPIKAMIEELFVNGETRPLELVWGARTQTDLYLDKKAREWQNNAHHFRYTPTLSSLDQKTLELLVFSHHRHDISDWQFVICGPFHWVYRVRDQLIAGGVMAKNMHSDAFQFEDPA